VHTRRYFVGSYAQEVGERILRELDVPKGNIELGKFSDGETRVEILEDVLERDVVLIQSFVPPFQNDALVELMLMADAARRASAARVVVVSPYLGGSRQDARKEEKNVPITASMLATVFEAIGIDCVITVEVHSDKISGMYRIPFFTLRPRNDFIEFFKGIPAISEAYAHGNLVIVSPDAGGVERARAYSEKLVTDLAFVNKKRSAPNKSHADKVIGEVRGKTAILIDDMADTFGSMSDAARIVLAEGAVKVYAAAMHPVLSGPAIERLEKSALESLIVSDSIPLSRRALECKKILTVSLAPLIAKKIRAKLTGVDA